MNIVEILKAARAKIEKPENWCRGTFAEDARGCRVPADHVDACKWCAWGALLSVMSADGIHCAPLVAKSLGEFILPTPCLYDPLAEFNDALGRQHSEVIDLFDKAIAAEEAKLAA